MTGLYPGFYINVIF